MAEHRGGQWNVAVKENEVYLERVSEDNEQLFDDSLAPEEARELARLITKHADKISESGAATKDEDDEDSDDDSDDSDDSEDEDSDDDSDDDDPDEDESDEDESDDDSDEDDDSEKSKDSKQ
jgi:hypothetical protein